MNSTTQYMGKKYFLTGVFIILTLFTERSNAQNTFSISGTVSDEQTEEPIAGAQIFLNGTTIGTTSNGDGYFELYGIPTGIFEVVASFLGYEISSATINTDSLASFYSFMLSPKVYEMDEVVVKPDPKRWQDDFELFSENFIGEGPFSADTKIINPEVLSFRFNPDDRTFTASANDQLIIENDALGYKIYYLLEFFVIDYSNGSSAYAGRPFFEPLTSSRRRTNHKWELNRELAYYGSFQHFMNSLISGHVADSGFVVKAEQRRDQKRYLASEAAPQRLYFFQIDSSTYELRFPDFLNITYLNEYEDPSYLKAISSPLDTNPRTGVMLQNTAITLAQDSVHVDRSGYIYEPTAILFDGYWGFEKLSDLLPLDYTPGK